MPDAAHSHPTVFLHIPQGQTQQGREALAKPPPALQSLREVIFRSIFLFSGLSSWFKLFSRLCTLFLQPALAPIRAGQGRANTSWCYMDLQEKHVIFTQQPVPSPQDSRLGREESARGSSPSITSIPRAGRQHRAPAHLLAAGTVLGEGSSAAARLNEQGAGTARVSQSSNPSSQKRLKCNSTQARSSGSLKLERWWWYLHGPASLGSGWISHHL